MDRTKLKNYAPQARTDFIRAVTDRASLYGLSEKGIEPITEKGDVVIIVGRAYPASVAARRKALEARIERNGFVQTMEALAYTWFNRFVAIRFMELNGYLDHGYRVLSSPDPAKTIPEILERAEHVNLEGLNKEKVIDLKLDGSKEVELFQMLLVAQCNALHSAMPFLFERIDDETELLLPDNLLHSDSVIRKLVTEIQEEDWKEVEIIGWLYQFYIADKKDEVIGKVVASEDIPAATQLFTPNWIVKYLVQNTLGRQWLATYPQSSLRQQMPYYIVPAEQTPEVQEQLKAITPTSLNPEELTLLDPASGSGHILVEAYDLLKAIYQERGYRAKDIPALILQKNLFGLEIDARAAQLAAFALMMKARADDRRIFESEAKPNILAFEDSQGLNAVDITNALNSPINKEDEPSEYLFEEIEEEKAGLFSKKALAEKGHVSQADIASVLALFEHAKTFGSLIQVPPKLAAKLPSIEQRLNQVLKHGDLTHAPSHVIKPLLRQAWLLAGQYDTVVANPPYMGRKYYNLRLRVFVGDNFKDTSADLYSCFIERNLALTKANGFVGMITIPNWMFLPSFEVLRRSLSKGQTIDSFVHNGRGIFGSDFGSCSFVLRNRSISQFRGVFRKLFVKQGSVSGNVELEQRFFDGQSFLACPDDFKKLPGELIAYWLSDAEREAFGSSALLSTVAQPRQGLATTDDERFIRLWTEVSASNTCFAATSAQVARSSGRKWLPLNKGGAFRRWYGNLIHVLNWTDDGAELKNLIRQRYGSPSKRIYNEQYYFKPGVTYSNISIADPSFRWLPPGCIISCVGQAVYSETIDLLLLLGYLNSHVATRFLGVLSPTSHFDVGQIANLPFRIPRSEVTENVKELIELFRNDWNSLEMSWDFLRCPLLCGDTATVEEAVTRWTEVCAGHTAKAKALEEENNRLFIDCFGLQGQLTSTVAESQITLTSSTRAEETKRLLSYAIGCMMGRYSLDRPGLIYAHSGNESFDPGLYKSFRADDDGIVPFFETDWGIRDDAANRTVEFVGEAWPNERLEENLKFIADSIGPTSNEQPRDTIRRYLATAFYKHHLSMYKRRPIYWLFSSGKQRAFQCLVYLHRYNEGTLSRMRTEYVIPLLGKLASRIEQLASDIQKTTATSHRKKLEKERDTRLKQQIELQVFDEKLRHHGDLRIKLDLDDGVKVNYGKFGNLLAEVNAVTGGSDD